MPPKNPKVQKAKSASSKHNGADKPRDEHPALPKQENDDSIDAKPDQATTAIKGESTPPPTTSSSKKRKPLPLARPHEPQKAQRRSVRGAPKPSVSQIQMLKFLLSPAALDLCRPHDEIADLEKRGKDTRTYSASAFSPFEELLCAVILSRPISHALGLRTIRTIFNEPYDFSTPGKVRDAGTEGRHQAVWDARTQHKAKTAEELGGVADVVLERWADGDEDSTLEGVRKEGEWDVEKERNVLKTHIKGLGPTGLDIFFRRIQGVWPKSYPFADHRTLAATEKLGLPHTTQGLKTLLGENWADLEVEDIDAKDEDEKTRKAFVRLLERAVGADLEKKIEEVKREAGKI
ncbi:MAG: hypothetical protein M1827_004354 [Pycnora praestabilis]|nr:MAG: hypothetical protein M1827_004354 [Pycnora praestabilis]